MFWFNGWTVYLMKGVSNMALKKYIGLRYAPKFVGAWDKTSEYAALSVVYTNDQSYVSRKTVPANTEITDTEFWIKSADWNAQVAQYNQNVERYEAEVLEYAKTVNSLVGKTVYTYNTKDDMAADKRVQLNDTLMTCGYAEVGDKKGSFYKAVAQTSAKAIALQNNLYAQPFEVYENNTEYVTPEQFGAVGDGVTDDTVAFNDALQSTSVLYLRNTTYAINPDIGIQCANKTIIGNGATIKALPSGKQGYSIINIENSAHASIENLTIIGDRNEHTGTGGEWGHGIDIEDSLNVTVNNVTVKNCWGDGIYIGNASDDTPKAQCKNIKILNCVISNNRRNNISVISADGFLIDNCTIENCNGTNPESGIDIEVNNVDTQWCEGTISNCYFFNNKKNNLSVYTNPSGHTIYIIGNHFDCNTNNDYFDMQISGDAIIKDNVIHQMKNCALAKWKDGEVWCDGLVIVKPSTASVSTYTSVFTSYSGSTGVFKITNTVANTTGFKHPFFFGRSFSDSILFNNQYNETAITNYHSNGKLIGNGNTPITFGYDKVFDNGETYTDMYSIATSPVTHNYNNVTQAFETRYVNRGTSDITIIGPDFTGTIKARTTATLVYDGTSMYIVN